MEKNLWKQSCYSIAALLLLALLASILGGCINDTSKMSTNTLDITGNLGSYNETAKRAEMGMTKEICLAKDGVSDYGILIGESAGDETLALAEELSEYLNSIVGSEKSFKVYKDMSLQPLPAKFISLGDTKQSSTVDTLQLENDGYLIKSIGENIFIKTTDESDLHNGVYGFLENQLECMFVREDFDYVPSFPTIYLDSLDVVSNPYFAWRKMHQYEVAQNGWFRKLKNNGTVDGEVEAFNNWGHWSHSVFYYVDPKIYLEDHPEYFSIVDGEARQLCLTNPDIYPIIKEKMKEFTEAKPDVKYWDFSINDNRDYCQCKNCAEVLKETGSMMGTMLPILNKLAQDFPDKIISTLAYYYNEKAPKGIACETNVNIVIAPIQTGQMYSYKFGATKSARRAKEVIEEWGRVAKNILIWDYVTDFRHMLMPFPNFDVQKDNHELYKENNVTAVFHQGSRVPSHELSRLRSYVLAQQLWDNNVDVNKIIAKYLTVTYGRGAENVALYLDKCNSELKQKGNNLDLYDKPSWHQNDYLSGKNNKYYLSLINDAIESEKDNEILVSRFEEIKINILYATMNEGGFDIGRKKAAFEEFVPLVRKHKVAQPYEAANPTMEEYIEEVYPKYLTNQKLALSACVILPVLGVAGVGLAVYLIIKRKRKRKVN